MTNTQQSHSFLIVGLGLTGLSCARFLVERDFAVAVMDTRDMPPALETVQTELPEVLVTTGGLEQSLLLKADTIVLSPGIDPRLPEIQAARDAGIEIIGDIELFTRYANAPVIAITGSNGKSTVTTMVAEMAVTAGKNVQVGGNLGVPALELIVEPAPDFYILELSSFQLETVAELNPLASVILNVSPDHMDRYDSVEQYQNVKAKIYSGADTQVINRDDEFVSQHLATDHKQVGFTLNEPVEGDFGVIERAGDAWLAHGSHPLLAVNDLAIGGKHNVANALAALVLGYAMDLPMLAMLTAIQSYRGLPHRCYVVADQNNIRWIDDSKATNIGACVAAIEGLAGNGRIILIAGGEGKDQDFSTLTSALEQYVSAVMLIGKDAELIAQHTPATVQKFAATDMFDAVGKAHEIAQANDIVLLSPACASFDMFTSYVHRGEVFAQAVKDVLS